MMKNAFKIICSLAITLCLAASVAGQAVFASPPNLIAPSPETGSGGGPLRSSQAEPSSVTPNTSQPISGAEGGRAGFAQPVEDSTPENPPESSSIPAPSTPSVSSEIPATPSESLPTTSSNEAANSNTSETASSSGISSAAASNSLSDVSPRVEDTNLLDEIDPFDLNANATGVRGFVERLYTLVMGRPAEKEGINHWINEMTSGKSTAANVAHFFFNSPEFENKNTSDEDFLKILYRTMMDREFDKSGFTYWKAFLDDGVSRNYVLRQFVVLPEFTRICERFGVQRGDFSLPENRDQRPELTAFVNRLYRHCMGREGDIGGLNHWTGRLMNRQETGASVVHFFFNSPEFTSKKLNDAEFLKTAYRTLFGREPDQVGFKYWMGVFKTGVSRNYILNSFVVLDEFTRACAAAGIERGSIPLGPSDMGNGGGNTGTSTLTITRNGQVVTDSSANILARIVAAEVGGFGNAETFKAQAIAAHSFILNRQARGVAAPAMPDREPTQQVKAAVAEVADIVVLYGGSPAFTPYYASSAGTTNYCHLFWKENLPYLVQVDSPHDTGANGYQVEKRISRADFVNIVLNTYRDLGAEAIAEITNIINNQPPSTWIQQPAKSSGSKYPSSRSMVSVCGRRPSIEFFYQNMVKIRSAAFDVRFDDASNSFIFTTYGFGHGVGMSQWGAYFFATKEGWGYEKILSHYYPGTTLARL